jgi:hypothetical protein
MDAKQRAFGILVVIVSMALSSCGPGQQFEPTITPTPIPTNTSTPTATPTTTPTPTAVPIQVEGWENTEVHTVCLTVNLSYPPRGGEINDPIAESVAELLKESNVVVVTDSTNCEMEITIDLVGEADPVTYTSDDNKQKQECYTRLFVHGTMVLSGTGVEDKQIGIWGSNDIPRMVLSSCAKTPDQVGSFGGAWEPAILSGLYKVWGTKVAIDALLFGNTTMKKSASDLIEQISQDNPDSLAPFTDVFVEQLRASDNTDTTNNLAIILGRIGPKAIEAVPALIDTLETFEMVYAWDFGHALANITGEEYTSDVAFWRYWWHLYSEMTVAEVAIEVFSASQTEVDEWADEDEVFNDTQTDVETIIRVLVLKADEDMDTAVDALIRALDEEDEGVVGAAADALGSLAPDSREAIPVLIEGFKIRKDYIPRHCREALVKFGAEAVLPLIDVALQNKDDWKQYSSQSKTALYTLQDITGEEMNFNAWETSGWEQAVDNFISRCRFWLEEQSG